MFSQESDGHTFIIGFIILIFGVGAFTDSTRYENVTIKQISQNKYSVSFDNLPGMWRTGFNVWSVDSEKEVRFENGYKLGIFAGPAIKAAIKEYLANQEFLRNVQNLK